MADVDTAPGDSFNKKIRNAQLYHYNFIMGMNDIKYCLPNAVIRTLDQVPTSYNYVLFAS